MMRGDLAIHETMTLRRVEPPPAWAISGSSPFVARGRGAAVHEISYDNIRINSLQVGSYEAGMFQISIRIRDGERVARVIPVLGLHARASCRIVQGGAIWRTGTPDLLAEAALTPSRNGRRWVWIVRIKNTGAAPIEWDAFYAMDVGLAPAGLLRLNEAYASHYVDHCAVETEHGYAILSRQNQPMHGERFPWALQGALPAAASFATDGLQVLGLGFRVRGEPEAWRAPRLPSRVMQYEMGCAAFTTAPQRAPAGATGEVRFFAEFAPHHPGASGAGDIPRVARAARWAARASWPNESESGEEHEAAEAPRLFGTPLLAGEPLGESELRARWKGEWRHVERRDGETLSFFDESGAHVVLGAKEQAVERPHGHILISGDPPGPEAEPLCSTVYAMGVFHSHLACGNPNFHRLLSVMRHPLNLQRGSGLRLFVECNGRWLQLGVPSVFAMHGQAAEWIYRFEGVTIEVISSAASNARALFLRARVAEGTAIRWRVTMDLEVEDRHCVRLVPDKDGVRIAPLSASGAPIAGGPVFAVCVKMGDAELEAAEMDIDASASLLEWGGPATRSLQICIRDTRDPAVEFPELGRTGTLFVRESWTGGVRAWGNAEAERIDTILPWFSHNAMVHFASPHGLEQFQGGAWGTRDVCQGPLEWLIATGRAEIAVSILQRVYAQQDAETGLWPQWFMTEPHGHIRQKHCHGDIVLWPLKALCDVLEATDDPSLVEMPIPWMGGDNRPRPATSLREHIDRQIRFLETDCIGGTALLRYRDGDWDDTLQPLRAAMRLRMTSAWTVMLEFETLNRFAQCARRYGWRDFERRCADLAERIEADVRRYLMKDGVIAGFGLFEGDGRVSLLLHPSDPSDGPRLRLLSINRGILSGLFTPAEARDHVRLLREHLLLQDGAHLMDRPVRYHGGLRTRFQRAETAAYFGREIALQYVHAHLRYCEAMAKLGEADALVTGLLAVNPADLSETVPNAEFRQSNAYFSSSDARFDTRAEAEARWDEARAGRVPVRGGWRIYSSGPGLFCGIALSKLFGWRRRFDRLELDPVIPGRWNGVRVQRLWQGAPVTIRYSVRAEARDMGVFLNGDPLAASLLEGNRYRRGGVSVPYDDFCRRLKANGNVLEIVIPLRRSP
jgi:CRISPR-associated protein Csx3